MTADLRSANAAMEPVARPIPHVDSEVHDFNWSTTYATLDFVSGYWQPLLLMDSQKTRSVNFPDGFYAPTRA